MDFTLEMMHFTLEMMEFTLEMMDFDLKVGDFCAQYWLMEARTSQVRWMNLKNDGFHTKVHGFYTNHDGFAAVQGPGGVYCAREVRWQGAQGQEVSDSAPLLLHLCHHFAHFCSTFAPLLLSFCSDFAIDTGTSRCLIISRRTIRRPSASAW